MKIHKVGQSQDELRAVLEQSVENIEGQCSAEGGGAVFRVILAAAGDEDPAISPPATR